MMPSCMENTTLFPSKTNLLLPGFMVVFAGYPGMKIRPTLSAVGFNLSYREDRWLCVYVDGGGGGGGEVSLHAL